MIIAAKVGKRNETTKYIPVKLYERNANTIQQDSFFLL